MLIIVEHAEGAAPSCKIGWVRVPGGAILEIFEFQPQSSAQAIPWNRVGLTHFSFNVRNTQKRYDYLVSKGVECVSKPERSPRGHTFFFARDFDGNLIEMIDLGYMHYVLQWFGPLGGLIFRRGMYKQDYAGRWVLGQRRTAPKASHRRGRRERRANCFSARSALSAVKSFGSGNAGLHRGSLGRRSHLQTDIVGQRLLNQKLVRSDLKKPVEIVSWLGAVQSQDYAGAKWALALRASALTDADVDRAFDRGDILRTHILRPTWHFVTPQDIRWMLALTAPRVLAGNRHYCRRTGSTKRSSHAAARSWNARSRADGI